jgi:hypothetical protein
MHRSAFKALIASTVSLGLASVPKAAAQPHPDDSRLLPAVDSLNPDARIDALAESLVIGRWEIDSRELGQKEDPQYRYRWVFHFSPAHTVEMRIWIKDGYGGVEGDPPAYFGLAEAGEWFIQDGKIGIISRQCLGLTASGQRECDIEVDEIGDTSFQVLQRGEDAVFLSSEESTGVRFPFKGRDRDMSNPDFWPTGSAWIDPKRGSRNRPSRAGREVPIFDVKGRQLAPGAESGKRAVAPF